MSQLTMDDQLARVTFDRFDLNAYNLFLKTKKLPESQLTFDWQTDTYEITTAARFAPMLGAEIPPATRHRSPIASHLFDYQQWAVEMALDAKRFAIWADTGLGKTAMYLEWVRHVREMAGGRVLILAPLSVIPQVQAEAVRWYGTHISRLDSRELLEPWCKDGDGIAITNYEKFIPGVMPELRYLAGIVADESSILRTGGGTIRWNLIKSARGIEYKLSCTATPAPNEAMEYASQAAFLEKLRNEGDILWTYFQRDKYGTWSVKPHAREAFYRFMASWSLYMRDPATFGFGDILASLPDPVMHEERIPLTDEQHELMLAMRIRSGKGLFGDDRMGVTERTQFAQIARGFLYEGSGKQRKVKRFPSRKVERVAEIIAAEVEAGRQVLVWTAFDEEGEVIEEYLRPSSTPAGRILIDTEGTFATLSGSQSQEERQELLNLFRSGDCRCLISKPSLIGYGLNLQFVTSMIFSGIDDSMERRYQAIRRAYRFGQTEPVHVWTPYIPELEGVMFDNVAQKEARFLEEVAAQERHYRQALEMGAA